MSRLDVSSEPSMEDILASIRKIIAEEPPGSRPLPGLSGQAAKEAPRAAAAPVPKAAFGRTGEPLTIEPVLTATPVMTASPGQSGAGFGAMTPVEPRFTPLVTLEPEPQPAASVARFELDAVVPKKVDAAIKSVEDQLSDLLGDDAIDTVKIAEPKLAAPRPAAAVPASQTFDFASMRLGQQQDEMPAAAPAQSSSQENAEPTFTVSRAGYIAEDHGASVAKTADPFEFDLGPSPFEAAKPPAATLELVEFAPVVASPAVPPKVNVDEIVTAVLENKPTLDALTTAPVMAASAPVAPAVQAFPEPFSTPVVKPSWAKISGDVTVPAVPASVDVKVPAAALPVEAVMPPGSAVETAQPSQAVRSMEDTVADLLRPMLRHWIQENMPRIVERALAREMSEQNSIARKTAAE